MVIAVTSHPRVDTAAYAKSKFSGKKLATDPAREACNTLGFQTLYDIPQPFQMEVRRKMISDHLSALKKGKLKGNVLTYSVFEWLADWMRWTWNHTPSLAWDEVLKQASDIAKHYDSIVHLESGKLRAYDGYIWRDIPNSQQIDRLMRGLYADLGVLKKVTFVKG